MAIHITGISFILERIIVTRRRIAGHPDRPRSSMSLRHGLRGRHARIALAPRDPLPVEIFQHRERQLAPHADGVAGLAPSEGGVPPRAASSTSILAASFSSVAENCWRWPRGRRPSAACSTSPPAARRALGGLEERALRFRADAGGSGAGRPRR